MALRVDDPAAYLSVARQDEPPPSKIPHDQEEKVPCREPDDFDLKVDPDPSCSVRWDVVLCETSMDPRYLVLWSMAFSFGMVDIATMVRYFAFATFMTGNSMHTAEASVDGCWHNFWRVVWLIVAYSVGMMNLRLTDLLRKSYEIKIGTATLLVPLIVISFAVADLVYYGYDARDEPYMNCGQRQTHGTWGLCILAHGFGIINGICMKVDKVTTNALTGHFLTAASAVFDQIDCVRRGVWLPRKEKERFLMSFGVITFFLVGVSVATAWQRAYGNIGVQKDASWNDYQPVFAVAGVVFGINLWLHDLLKMGDWRNEALQQKECLTIMMD
eukprot:TRINITY_DN31422_c0_g2_i1.p1 TRINITY_DN31422_c0_g2~~TRINITY_DN31422_c0_g2_i1.p1  ORF type:complete len:329 (-),score=62.15 TRINITY_DN31422_c0_g2_i1:229-1215(-)